ncbi:MULTISPECIES: flagellar hook-length control protein FliK [Enterobacteriaceae]|nr:MULTISPECIES: flagellar hook-length control protein FliK [Enterobacteriaceae]BBQ81596.1 flagellar hook-length control protein [Klebsiella sp. WP3-W18-ESBL-02]BBR18644.1 flagellar hook-length control protein [Klebsiella sp. WP3-S18-ESBL-05]
MDILNLSQGALNGSGLPAQAEPMVGSMGENGTAQTPTAFSDALLNVIDSMMAGQTLPGDLAVSAQPLSLDDDEDGADTQQLSGALLKDDAQQQLLETLLMTSQMPVQAPSYIHVAQPADDALRVSAQPILAPQTLAMSFTPSLQQQPVAATNTNIATPETAVSLQPSAQPLSPTLMTVMAPVTPAPTLESSHGVSSVTTSSAATLSATLKMDPEPSRWSEQLQSALGERLQVQVKQQIQHATIRLDPPDMGKIDISMQVDNGRVQVQINASHADVYRALQQTSNDLRQSLTEQNFVQVNVQVSSQSGGQQQGRGHSFTEQRDAIQAGAELTADALTAQDSRSDDSVLMTV